MRAIAVRRDLGANPGLFWLGGFKSDMKGTKAEALSDWARAQGRACVRFDYSGHGESGGEFAAGTIGRWLEESLAVFEANCAGPQVVIGSSIVMTVQTGPQVFGMPLLTLLGFAGYALAFFNSLWIIFGIWRSLKA